MTNERQYRGPLPSPDFRNQIADEVMAPFTDIISGEIVARVVRPLGIARYKGKIKSVNLTVGKDGKDDAGQHPSITGEVFINGVSVFTTKPGICHITGETSQQKTTYAEAADTGVLAATIDETANTFEVGDYLSWEAKYNGNASPTSKMSNVGIIVEVEPL